ncbi:hypothetical protein DPMN_111236 [Dreissena polymorpha]|uniref:Uncharacterized protein n=1 Tax=Dreissena polymorpha TaxID=45954 RepID=A0A9D4KE52_DREPO|nr:hypothetical protein DPMN_111236 [Dreissena polymorpha]
MNESPANELRLLVLTVGELIGDAWVSTILGCDTRESCPVTLNIKLSESVVSLQVVSLAPSDNVEDGEDPLVATGGLLCPLNNGACPPSLRGDSTGRGDPIKTGKGGYMDSPLIGGAPLVGCGVLAATVDARTRLVGAPSLVSRADAAAARIDIRAFTPAGYMSKALAIETTGKCDRAGTNSRKARWGRAIRFNPFQIGDKKIRNRNRRIDRKRCLKFHQVLAFRDPCYVT